MSRSAFLSLAKLSSAGDWKVLGKKAVRVVKQVEKKIPNFSGRGSALVMLWNVVVVGRRR